MTRSTTATLGRRPSSEVKLVCMGASHVSPSLPYARQTRAEVAFRTLLNFIAWCILLRFCSFFALPLPLPIRILFSSRPGHKTSCIHPFHTNTHPTSKPPSSKCQHASRLRHSQDAWYPHRDRQGALRVLLPQHGRQQRGKHAFELSPPVVWHTNQPTQVNWRKASEDFGSASVDSFKKMVASAYKKLNKANADTNGGDAGAGADSLATPKKNKGGRKRKVPDDDGEGESEAKPKKTPKKSTKKAGGKSRRVCLLTCRWKLTF